MSYTFQPIRAQIDFNPPITSIIIHLIFFKSNPLSMIISGVELLNKYLRLVSLRVVHYSTNQNTDRFQSNKHIHYYLSNYFNGNPLSMIISGVELLIISELAWTVGNKRQRNRYSQRSRPEEY